MLTQKKNSLQMSFSKILICEKLMVFAETAIHKSLGNPSPK
jgi:hypothetical protein